MIRVNRAGTAVVFAALTIGGFGCTPEPSGTPCTTVAACGAAPGACVENTCVNKVCGTANLAAGTRVGVQTTGDCKVTQCDGAGHAAAANDDSDLPVDFQECTDDVCTAGVPSNPPRAAASACGTGGLLKCDGQGNCVTCTAPADCGSASECQARTCVAGTCGVNNLARGTALASQTAGDCKVSQCDGNGATEIVNDDADVLADATNCTSNVCTAGVPSNPPVAAGTTCSEGTGTVCDGAGACVGCAAATDCPGTDGERQQRTCTAGVCGVAFTAQNTAAASQTAHDCKKNVCNGAGAVTLANDDADLPADDGNQCTAQVCSAGVPSFPIVPVDTACNQNGGVSCSGAGTCVACNGATQCAGSDTDCQARTCTAGACGLSFQASGTATTSQTPGDCKVNQCDGAGNIVAANSSADVPADDGNQCTTEICTGGVPSHPAAPADTACSQGGGSVCSAGGSCVACNGATQCPGSDTECQTRTCSANTCGFSYTASGFVLTAQASGDCKQAQCDGAGAIVPVAFDTDLPVDSNQCTADVCTAGAPSNPFESLGTACSQSGGTVCDGAGACVPVPVVASTSPADGTTPIAAPTISVTFTTAMNPATLTGQTAAGACSGSIQVSLDNFASCLAFSSSSAVMSGGDTTGTFTAAPGLLVNQLYQIRVTTAATSAIGVALAAQFTQAGGFITTSPNLCNGSLVISQVYGGGGLAGATYKNDFMELHNRGTTSVNLSGLSIQYASTSGTTWSKLNLAGSVPAGGYFLIQLFSGGAVGATLPTPDQTATIDLAGGNGKLALVNSTVALTGSCPLGATVLDFVGYGTANCSEGGTAAPAPTSSTANLRVQSGCGDIDRNASDFSLTVPVPHNSATAPSTCACTVENESNAALEADFCDVQSPQLLTAQTGVATALVYGQIYEAGATEAAGANTGVRAQLGYGLASANPEYEPGWTWTNATYNVQAGNNDEYQASFTAPAVGSYRYAYRFSLDQGVSWTYCDGTGGNGGAGSNAGLSFETNQLPVLTVTP